MFMEYHPSSTGKNAVDKYVACSVKPTAGSMVIFHHDLYHSGAPLQDGTKFILRTDIFFRVEKSHSLLVESSLKIKKQVENIGSSPIREMQKYLTIKDLCKGLNFSDEELKLYEEALINLDMFECSVESFCAPGFETLISLLDDVIRKPEFSNRTRFFVNQAFNALP